MPNDLTDSEFWNKTFSGKRFDKNRISAWIRGKIHWKFDRMICRMLDRSGNAQAEVIELGCAPGTILERIHRLRPKCRLAGIDYSVDGIDIARKRLDALGIDADVYFGDFRTASLLKQYDVALSFGLIEHFEDPIAIIEYHKKYLRPGGLVAVSVPNFSHPIVKTLLKRFDPDIL